MEILVNRFNGATGEVFHLDPILQIIIVGLYLPALMIQILEDLMRVKALIN
jgi:hypothetical protein